MKSVGAVISIGLWVCFSLSVAASTALCHGRLINPVTDICWRCLFPITIGASHVVSSDLPDTENPHETLCVCPGDPFPNVGFALGYWEPMALVDVTRTPYCFVTLGAAHIQHEEKAQGAVETQTPDQHGSFYHVHVYHFPILQWIDSELLGGSCQSPGNFEMVYMSELDPTWRDENLALIVFPETRQFLNPMTALTSQAACLLDALSANTGLPSDNTFWCAGSQGLMYPLTGKVAEHVGSVQATTLLSERILFKLHRLGRMGDTNAQSLCGDRVNFIMPKSRYRYQMVYPKPASCQPFGRSTMLWGSLVMNPLYGDDTSYLIWRKKNCCH